MAKRQETENEILETVEEKDQKVEESKKVQSEKKFSLKEGGTRLS